MSLEVRRQSSAKQAHKINAARRLKKRENEHIAEAEAQARQEAARQPDETLAQAFVLGEHPNPAKATNCDEGNDLSEYPHQEMSKK